MRPDQPTPRLGDRARRVLIVVSVIVTAAILLTGPTQPGPRRAHERARAPRMPSASASPRASTLPAPAPPAAGVGDAEVRGQDPQDRRGSAAARRASRTFAAHRALEHVPYRHGPVTVQLTGALRDGSAVLTVTAPTIRQARSGWRRFLAQYHDPGRAYLARLHASTRGGDPDRQRRSRGEAGHA